jgi:TPP-dependent pyruvate/acetoin dehydrogenase alpha subunit
MKGYLTMTVQDAAQTEQAETLTLIYRNMVRTRALDDMLIDLTAQRRLNMSWHSGRGQEALCALYSQLRPDDFCGYTHRGCYVWVCKGIDMGQVIAEQQGKVGGTSKGKGGTHISGWKQGVFGRSGMQGGHFAIYTGAAEVSKMLGNDRVAVCSFGDGAATSGNLHESAAHAAARKLPVIYACENNGFNMSVRLDAYWAQPDIAKLAIGWGMPYSIVDGNDAVAVAAAAREAIDRARGGGGPTFLEMKTYRVRGHQENDRELSGYRTREEVQEWVHKEPVDRLRRYLLDLEILTAGQVEAIEAAAQQEVAGGVEYAEASPLPQPEDAFTDLYVEA